ncbi:Proteasome subunit beta type-3 [Fusarium oxysporum f. sp. albedinis]|nr:Proteasome subunit beta type-3 [Fusarium oxysporum f. sp. albedinis]
MIIGGDEGVDQARCLTLDSRAWPGVDEMPRRFNMHHLKYCSTLPLKKAICSPASLGPAVKVSAVRCNLLILSQKG